MEFLIPGTQFTLNGQADRGGGLLPHGGHHRDRSHQSDQWRTTGHLEKDINEGAIQEPVELPGVTTAQTFGTW
jgi:hypothetical protein